MVGYGEDAKDGNPLVGCSVQIKGTSKGAITNMKGQYTIQAKKGETLLFQYIGYKQERRVVKSATLDVKMKADDVVLTEAIGYNDSSWLNDVNGSPFANEVVLSFLKKARKQKTIMLANPKPYN